MKDNARIFKFISESTIRKDYIDLSTWQFLELRNRLTKGVYWVQPTERGKIHWNWILLQNYLTNDNLDTHQLLVQEYLTSIAQ